MEAKIKRQAGHSKRGLLLLIAAGSRGQKMLVDISLSGMLSVVMLKDYSDFQHNYFCLTEKRLV